MSSAEASETIIGSSSAAGRFESASALAIWRRRMSGSCAKAVWEIRPTIKQAASAEGNSLLETKGELLLKIIYAATTLVRGSPWEGKAILMAEKRLNKRQCDCFVTNHKCA